MPDELRPYIARVVAALIAGLAMWAEGKLGWKIDQDTQLAISTVVVFLVYGVAHKMLDSKVNPHDAASIHAAKETKGAP